jgi:hypothetical protein
MSESTETVLVLGGTGVFGRLIVADLLTHTPYSVAVASRRGIRARGWLPGSEGRVTSLRLDARDERAIRAGITRSGARVVIHAAGPYALIGEAPLRAALACRLPYVDMCPRSDLYASLRERYDERARAVGVPCLLGASTAGGLTGLLTRYARRRMPLIERVRSALCVHNFAWGTGVVADYLLSAWRVLPAGQVGTHPERVVFPTLGARTVWLADTLDYAEDAPERVADVAYRVGLPDPLPALGFQVSAALARRGVPMWRLAGVFGVLAGVLGGAYTEGGLLHQAFGEGTEGRGTFETHIYRPYGNVRNPSLLCALAAPRLLRGEMEGTGFIHPAAWLDPEELLEAMRARAVVVRSRFRRDGAPPDLPWQEEKPVGWAAREELA